jgi:hypothetical protein
MRHFIPVILSAAALTAQAQVVSFGVKGGVPVMSALPDYYGTNGLVDTGRWTVGPTIEFHLFRGLSAEVDALYRGYRVQSSFSSPATIASGVNFVQLYPAFSSSGQQDTKVWEFPLLLKYRFGGKVWRPFVDGGYVGSHQSTDARVSFTCLDTPDACAAGGIGPYTFSNQHFSFSGNSRGGMAGVGVEYKIGRFKIDPEVRYTRRNVFNKNQVSLIVGFTF